MKSICTLVVIILWSTVSSPAQYLIKNSVISNGAGVQADEQQRLVCAVGQAVVGTIHDDACYVHAGFLQQSGRWVTDVAQLPAGLPPAYRLSQNHPNPFNPATTIEFALPKTGQVSIKIYDLRGREVAVLIDGFYPSGVYKAVFDARALPTGVYFYRMQADHFNVVRKAMFVK